MRCQRVFRVGCLPRALAVVWVVLGAVLPFALAEAECPLLLSPAAGEVMDNGRSDWLDDVVWVFRWTGCEGADAYRLRVEWGRPTDTAAPARFDVETQLTEHTATSERSLGGYMLEGWSWQVQARIGGAWGPWSEQRAFSVEPEDSDPIADFGPPGTCPVLLEPEDGAVLDNGRSDMLDASIWPFAWTPCPGAAAYWLVVLREGEAAAVISDRRILGDRYDVVDRSIIPDSDLTGWSWRVRAQVDDVWQPWSAPRGFSVEPPDSDPPRVDLMTPSLQYPVVGQTLPNAGTYPDMHVDDAWWFSWAHVPSAVGYQFVVTAPHLREPFLDVTFDEAWVAGRCDWYRATNRGSCSFGTGPGATALPAGMGDWTWRVRARLGTGWAPWSEAAAFAIGPAPGGAEAWIEGRLEGWTAGPARIAGFVWSDLPPLGDGSLAADGTFRLHLPAMAVGEYYSELPGDGGPGRLVVFAVLEVSQADGDATSSAVLATSFEAGLMAWAEPSDHAADDAMVSWWFADGPITYVGSWQHAYGETRVDVELRHGWNMVLVQVIEVMDDNTWVLLARTVEELPAAVAWHWLPDRE